MALEVNIVVSILVGTLIAATPLYIAALGELFAERSGVINIGLEGVMLMGAVIAVIVDISTNSIFFAILFALLVGALFGLFHGILSIFLHINQIATGLSFFILCNGLSGYLGTNFVGLKIRGLENYAIPILADIPFLGKVLFNHSPFVYFAIISIPLTWLLLHRNRWGISVKACGENPYKAYSAGVNVQKVRLLASVFSGAFAGLGGACLSLAIAQSWSAEMVAGRGWIAIGMIIFARWNPVYLFLGALIYGAMSSVNFNLQIIGSNISFHFLSMLPYLITILVLVYANMQFKNSNKNIPLSMGQSFYI
jgi:general nucleoside transport system permease protein